MSLGKEPTLIIGTVVAALTAISAALPVGSTAHGIVAAILIGLGAVTTRTQVKPK